MKQYKPGDIVKLDFRDCCISGEGVGEIESITYYDADRDSIDEITIKNARIEFTDAAQLTLSDIPVDNEGPSEG